MPADVSVVIPTRNRLPLLRQALRTVLEQRGVAVEVVIVDEACSDGTGAWLDALDDPRVRVLRNDTPTGLSAARNAGISEARAPWIAFLDDDDLWMPDKLRWQLDALQREGAPWSFGTVCNFTDEPRLLEVLRAPPPEDVVAHLPWSNMVPAGGSNVIAARSLLAAAGPFDTSLRTVEDWDMWIRLADTGPPAVVAEPVVGYRVHRGNMSKGVAAMLEGVAVLEERYRAHRGGASLDWAELHRWMIYAARHSGDRRSARRLALASARARHPGSARRLLKALAPIRPRPPVGRPEEASGLLDRLRPRRVVAWPPGVEEWLIEALSR